MTAVIGTAAYDRLSTFPAFQDMVLSGLIGSDAEPTDPDADRLSKAWLFRGLDDEGRPFRDPEGSGTSVVVLIDREEWSGLNNHNTFPFPVLRILVYSDSTRNPDGTATQRDGEDKVKAILDMLDRCFHLPGNEAADQRWGDTWVHSSLRGGVRSIRDVPQTQSLTIRGEVPYNLVTD